VPEEENEKNERDRNPQKPKQNTATHNNLPPDLLAKWIDLELSQSDAINWLYNQDPRNLFLAMLRNLLPSFDFSANAR
jgi:hypothetical protein